MTDYTGTGSNKWWFLPSQLQVKKLNYICCVMEIIPMQGRQAVSYELR